MKSLIAYQEEVMNLKKQDIELTDINALKIMIEDLRSELERLKEVNKLK